MYKFIKLSGIILGSFNDASNSVQKLRRIIIYMNKKAIKILWLSQTCVPGFSGRLLTTIYKQTEFTLRIADQLIQKMNF